MSRYFKHTVPSRRGLVAAIVAALLPASALAGPKVEFDAGMLFGGASASLDIRRFEQGDLPPGTYSADIIINDALVGRRDIVARVAEDDMVRICLDPALFELMALNEKRLESLRDTDEGRGLLPLPAEVTCLPLSDFVPGASVDFDSGEQSLHLSIPQLYLLRSPRGSVDSSQWDAGVSAATLGYNINHSRQRNGRQEHSHTSVTVDAGLNFGGGAAASQWLPAAFGCHWHRLPGGPQLSAAESAFGGCAAHSR